MKRIFVLITGMLLITGLVSVIDAPMVQAQSKKEARACYQEYDGHGSGNGTDGKLTKDFQKQYNRSDCPQSKGGNCDITSGGSAAKISCDDPDYVPVVNTTTSTIAPVQDPAFQRNAICNADKCEIISKYLNPFIQLLAIVVGLAVVIGIIWGGIQIAMSAGDPQQSASGKNHIRSALIGLIAFAVLYSVIEWILPGGFL